MTTKEIHERSADGLTVTLYANFYDNVFGETENVEITCRVNDTRTGQDFTIQDIPPERALDVFNHPFVYANNVLVAGKL